MKRRRLAALLLVASAAGCSKQCGTPETSPSGCWHHEGSTLDDLECSTGSPEYEPNGDVVAANVLPDGKCDTQTFHGSVSHDTDVFRADGPPCRKGAQPHATLITQEDDLRLCLFVACAHGKTALSKCEGDPYPASQNHMPEGVQGCCRVGQGTLTTSVTCDSEWAALGHAPEWQAYFVVDRLNGSACTNYQVNYAF